MSGSTGSVRIKSRNDFIHYIQSYTKLLQGFNNFVSLIPSGSFNSDLTKDTFGDIDLIVELNSNKLKKDIKLDLINYLINFDSNVICPFISEKYKDKRYLNTGEIVTIRYFDKELGYAVQIDNIISLNKQESNFKYTFLNIPAEVQGLIIGLIKVACIEENYIDLFNRLNINVNTRLNEYQEFEFNISSIELQLRKITFVKDSFKQYKREILWTTQDFSYVYKILDCYNLDTDFFNLIEQIKYNIKNRRSFIRIKGLFKDMITIKSGEYNTDKGNKKQIALDIVNNL